jgi:hypothetical protein
VASRSPPDRVELFSHDDAVVERHGSAGQLLLRLMALPGDDDDVAGAYFS